MTIISLGQSVSPPPSRCRLIAGVPKATDVVGLAIDERGQYRAMLTCKHGICCILGNLFSVSCRCQMTSKRSIPISRPKNLSSLTHTKQII